MSTVGKAPKKASDHIPFFHDQGLDYVVATLDNNKVMITGSATLAGGAATVTLPVSMADTSYSVHLTSDGAVAAWGSKAVGSFAIAGTGTDVVDWMVVGKIASQA